MAKCPCCDARDTSWTNPVEVVGANAAGAAAGAIMSMISPTMSTRAHYEASRSLVEYKEYHCNSCGRDFKKNRRTGDVIKI